ncbi:DUF1294 domain-containing protein [Stutzerimonas xanthomarina]|uniref:DUF1294 domain-containing protein n=1 Tax=Stutzerimonas xanthomarina TaxID=271420 RepID=UPI003AA80547
MESRGQLKSWNDQKGFGFIRPEQGSEEIFAHISAMRGTRRPVQNDRVLYISERDEDGRLRATHIRLDAGLSLDEPAIRRKPPAVAIQSAHNKSFQSRPNPKARPRRNEAIRWPLPKLFGLTLLSLLPALGLFRMAGHGSYWPLYAYLLGSLLAFGLYVHDKRSALRSGWRTPEARLHLVELLGGWPGALVAQQALRHKTRKLSFQLVFWLIVIVHQAAWLDYLYFQRMYQLLPQI